MTDPINQPIHATLRERLAYDPITGDLTWRTRVKGAKVGAVVGCVCPVSGYRRVYILGRRLAVHRIAWLLTTGEWPASLIDHINGDRADNRLANLREADWHINAQNMRTGHRSGKSGLLGAHWVESAQKWQSQIQVKGCDVYLGRFATADAAHEAYVAAKRRLHPGGVL